MSETMDMPVGGTRMVVLFPGPVAFRMPVSTICTPPLLPFPEVLSSDTVTNWSNSPTSSAVVRCTGALVTFFPPWRTTAEKLACGTGIDARSVVRFCRRAVSVELRLSVLSPLRSLSSPEVEILWGCL